jgi:hypothetical protein
MAFRFRLDNEDGTPADPPVLHMAVPNWSAATRSGSTPLRRFGQSRPVFATEEPVLVVEPV